MFKKLSSLRIPEKRQGLIYYTCVNYDDLPGSTKELIREVCRAVVYDHARIVQEVYERALFEYITSGRTIMSIAQKYFLRENTLKEMRRDFYARFNEQIRKTL